MNFYDILILGQIKDQEGFDIRDSKKVNNLGDHMSPHVLQKGEILDVLECPSAQLALREAAINVE